MSYKSRSGWFVEICLKKCENRGAGCGICVGFSNLKEVTDVDNGVGVYDNRTDGGVVCDTGIHQSSVGQDE